MMTSSFETLKRMNNQICLGLKLQYNIIHDSIKGDSGYGNIFLKSFAWIGVVLSSASQHLY